MDGAIPGRDKSAAGVYVGAGPGGRRAAEELLPLVYDQLRALARRHLDGERAEHTLQPTALVHEAYMRLVGACPGGDGSCDRPRWAGRGHFLHAAAEAMRRVLIDHARARGAVRRGGSSGGAVGGTNGSGDSDPGPVPVPARWRRVPFSALDLAVGPDADPATMLALDDLMARLDRQDRHLAAVVRLRFFAGLSVEETAGALGVSTATIKRDWAFARAWLFRRLNE